MGEQKGGWFACATNWPVLPHVRYGYGGEKSAAAAASLAAAAVFPNGSRYFAEGGSSSLGENRGQPKNTERTLHLRGADVCHRATFAGVRRETRARKRKRRNVAGFVASIRRSKRSELGWRDQDSALRWRRNGHAANEKTSRWKRDAELFFATFQTDRSQRIPRTNAEPPNGVHFVISPSTLPLPTPLPYSWREKKEEEPRTVCSCSEEASGRNRGGRRAREFESLDTLSALEPEARWRIERTRRAWEG
ncbi:hypothetical protein K0M31_017569 [Melipona bicolor]|uniref:Uncharacterized protein n=1 Tax=Melipona bicolor TaxID=60889 RepID=A0AA40G5B3_9HYME|nr:hypothetical protein K0M31_017569 [Melipona bicolor]